MKLLVNDIDWLAIDWECLENALLGVVVNAWLECAEVLVHTLVENLWCIILTDNEWFASDIICHWLLWWICDLVVNTARTWVEETAADALTEFIDVDGKVENMCEWCSHLSEESIELLNLADCTWDTIEDVTVVVGVLLHACLKDIHDCIIIDKAARLNDALYTLAKWCLAADFGTESITCGNLVEVELLFKEFGLCALADTRWAEENDHTILLAGGKTLS